MIYCGECEAQQDPITKMIPHDESCSRYGSVGHWDEPVRLQHKSIIIRVTQNELQTIIDALDILSPDNDEDEAVRVRLFNKLSADMSRSFPQGREAIAKSTRLALYEM